MKIQSVFIDGFKNLSNISLNLNNMTALVSLNNFGKSNVLTAIDFAIKFIQANPTLKKEMMNNSKLMPMNQFTLGRDYFFKIESTTIIGKNKYRVEYGFSFSWGNNKNEPIIKSEILRVKLEEKDQKYVKYIERNPNRAFYKSSEQGRCSTVVRIADTELVINKLQAYDSLFYSEIIEKINNLRFYMENNLDAKSFYRIDPIITKGLDDLLVNSENLPRIIYQLQSKEPKKFQLLKNVYSQLFPHVENIIAQRFNFDHKGMGLKDFPENIPISFSDSVYVLYVKMNNLVAPVDFNIMSDGAKRVFMILTKVILSKISNVSLVAIEEPENSVHPSLFRSYINIISQLLDDCRVIITSHSPYIINYFEPSWIRVGVEKQDGVAEFFEFKSCGAKKLQKDAIELGTNIGDYLFALLADSESNLDEYLECAKK